MTYLIYARVSPKGSAWAGTETSISTQIAECRAAILSKDPEARIETLSDEFLTGANTKRPGAQRIIRELKDRTASWDCLVIFHLDRLTRSLVDAIPLFELLRDNGKGLIAVRQNIDMFSAGGRAMVYMLVIFAQFEREMNSERTKAKMYSICNQGGIPYGKAPFGYVRQGKGNNILAPDPEKAEIVRGIFRSYGKDRHSVNILSDRYKIHPQSIINILRNKIYYGVISYGGKEYQGKHEPIIKKSDYDTAQSYLPGKRSAPRPMARKYDYLLSGLLKCECGHCLTPYSVNKGGKRYFYYRCTDLINCADKYHPAEKLDRAVLESIKAAKLDAGEIEAVTAGYNKAMREYLAGTVPELNEAEDRKKELTIRQAEIEKVFLSGQVTDNNKLLWNKRLAEVTREIEILDLRIDELSIIRTKTGGELKAADIVGRMEYFSKLMEEAGEDIQNQRNLLLSKIQEITALSDGYSLKLVMTKSSEWLPGQELVITLFIKL